MAWMYGGADGVGVVTGQQGVAHCVGVMWWVGSGRSWCGSDSGGVGVSGGWGLACCVEGVWQVGKVLHVVLRWHGSWHVLGWGGSELAGGRVSRAVLGWHGGWWWLGLACHVEVVWQVGWWWRGRMEVAHVHEQPAISRVLRAMLGQQGGLVVAGCWGRMEVAHMHKWPVISRLKVLRAVLGQ
ncbi:hypothetical protein EDB86DRAFT_2824917 [Lactarius hatsudake]|nr:hypothetical protein EDB86DRAFT_2824917 [Lactarius hatsudake]